jgi:hypothetical protein
MNNEKSKYFNPLSDWRETICVGDILIMPSGSWRAVRTVKYWPDDDWCKSRRGLLAYIDFAIRRCSWTGRPETTVSRQTIKKWSKLQGARAKLNTDADKKLLDDIERKLPFSKESYNYDCCDAKSFI